MQEGVSIVTSSFHLPPSTQWQLRFWASALEVQLRQKVNPLILPYILSFNSLSNFAALPVRTASKRRAAAPRVQREVAPATSIRRTRSTRIAAKKQEAENPSDQENEEANNKNSDPALSKHTLREKQGVSPTKIKSHFRNSKLVEGKLRESEGCIRKIEVANM